MKRNLSSWKRIDGHTVQWVAARSLLHKFRKLSPAWTKSERLLMGLLHGNRKSHPWKLSITTEKGYIPLLNLEVFQLIEELTFSCNWFLGSVRDPKWSPTSNDPQIFSHATRNDPRSECQVPIFSYFLSLFLFSPICKTKNSYFSYFLAGEAKICNKI